MAKKKRKPIGIVSRIIGRIAEEMLRLGEPLSDKEFEGVSDALFASSTHLANVSAVNFQDLDLKLAILCRRLRDQIDPEDRTAVLNSLIAESIRDDLLIISVLKD